MSKLDDYRATVAECNAIERQRHELSITHARLLNQFYARHKIRFAETGGVYIEGKPGYYASIEEALTARTSE